MKKYVIALIASVVALIEIHPVSADITPWDYDGLYARATVITEIEWGEDGINLITVQECNGFLYQYYDDADDLLVGDIMSCIFFVCNGWVYLTGSFREVQRDIYVDSQTGKLFAEWCSKMIEVEPDGDYFNSVEPY